MSFAALVTTSGVPSDRTRDQFAAEILYHPKGEPGQVYVAQVIHCVRANSLGELQAYVADFAWNEAGL